jgi:hypothetical protein
MKQDWTAQSCMRIALDRNQESASSDDEPLMLLKSRTPHILKATPKATKTSPSIHVVLAYLQKTKVAKEESNRSTVLRMG